MKSHNLSQFQHTEAPQHMPHIKCTHGTHHMTGHEATEYRELTCACKFVWGNKDPAKMMHATMALVERGLGTRQASTQSQSA